MSPPAAAPLLADIPPAHAAAPAPPPLQHALSPKPSQSSVPVPLWLRFLSHPRALFIFCLTLALLTGLVIALMAVIQALDPPTPEHPVAHEIIPNSVETTLRPRIEDAPMDDALSGSNDTPKQEAAAPASTTDLPPDPALSDDASSSFPLSALTVPLSDLGDAVVDTVLANSNPTISDTRITALQFLWLVSPAVATLVMRFAMKRYQKKHATPEHSTQNIKGDKSQSSTDTPPGPTPSSAPSKANQPAAECNCDRSGGVSLPPVPGQVGVCGDAALVTEVGSPTLGLEQIPQFQPLAQAVLQQPDGDADGGPTLASAGGKGVSGADDDDIDADSLESVLGSCTCAGDQPPALPSAVTVTAVHPATGTGANGKSLATTPDTSKASTGQPVEDEDDDLFVASGADLLQRLPYLPFFGLGLPDLLLETRSKNHAAMKAARARQPWYERLGLRLILSTHLPHPRLKLRRWIFRTRYARLQRCPSFVAFLIAAVALPTLWPSVFAVAQYIIASASGAQGWYTSGSIAHLRSSFNLSITAPAWGAILLGFVYELLVGSWWDIIPKSSADWGNGLGFSGASWILLAIVEEFGWMGGLFPALYYNQGIRNTSAKITQWYYRNKSPQGEQGTRRQRGSSISTCNDQLGPASSHAAAAAAASAAYATSRPSSQQQLRGHQDGSTRLDVAVTPPTTSTPTGAGVASTPRQSTRALMSNGTASPSASAPPGSSPLAFEWIHMSLVCVLLGSVWSAWHWPFILLKRSWLPEGVGYVPGTVDTPMAFGFLMWVPRIICTRFVGVYLSLMAGSWWAVIVFHAAHNVMVYSYWAVLPDTDGDAYPFARFMHAESGITVVIAYVLSAMAIVAKWKRHDERHGKLVVTSPELAPVQPQPQQPQQQQQQQQQHTAAPARG